MNLIDVLSCLVICEFIGKLEYLKYGDKQSSRPRYYKTLLR